MTQTFFTQCVTRLPPLPPAQWDVSKASPQGLSTHSPPGACPCTWEQDEPAFVCTFSALDLESTIFQVARFPVKGMVFRGHNLGARVFTASRPSLLTGGRKWPLLFHLSTSSPPHVHFPFLWHQFLD